MKRILCTLLAFVLVLSMASVSLADCTLMTAKTTHENWPILQALIEERTGVKINALTSPSDSDDRVAKFTTILTSGDDSIDLLHINDEMMTQYIAAGLLEPLNDVITPELSKNYDQAFMADRFMSDGKIYGVPNFNSTLVMYVNQDMLNAAGVSVPTNLDEFTAAIKAMSKPEEGIYGYGGAWEATYSHVELHWFINQFGGDVYDWTNEKSRAALQYMYDMANTWNCTSKAQLSEQYESMEQKFYDGKYGIILDWAGPVEGLAQAAGLYGPDHIHSMPIPTFENNATYASSWYFVLNPNSKNFEDAKKVLAFIASDEYAVTYLRLFNQPPARVDVLYSDELQSEEFDINRDILNTLAEYNKVSTVRGRPMLPAAMEYITEIGTIFQQYILDEITLDELGALQLEAYERCK